MAEKTVTEQPVATDTEVFKSQVSFEMRLNSANDGFQEIIPNPRTEVVLGWDFVCIQIPKIQS